MHRAAFLLSLCSALFLIDCSCDPPYVAPGDGGPGGGDGGVGDDGGGGQGLLTGLMWAQLDDGTVAQVSLGTGTVTYPLGRGWVGGTIVRGPGDTIVHFEGIDREPGFDTPLGRLIQLDPTTGARTVGNEVLDVPLQLAFSGDQVAIGAGSGTAASFGTWGEDEGLTQMSFLGGGLAHDDVGLVVSTYDGLRRVDAAQAYATTRRCDSMVHVAAEGAFLCGDSNGDGVHLLNTETGAETVVFDTTGDPLAWAVDTSDGYIATRIDCTIEPADYADLEPLCPFGIVELGDELYFTSQYGGMYARDADGDVRLVATFLEWAGGIDDNGTATVFGASRADRLLVTSETLYEPRLTPEGETPVGVAAAADGSVWLVGDDGATRSEDGDDSWTQVTALDPPAVHASRGGETLYVARGTAGLSRLDLSAGAAATAEDASTARADLVAGCSGTRALVVDTDAGAVRVLDGDAETDRLTDLSPYGDVTAVGCSDDTWLVLGNADGELWAGRIDDDGALTDAGLLKSAPRHLAPATDG